MAGTVILLVGFLLGQRLEPSILVGSSQLTLGMPEATVLAKVGVEFDLSQAGEFWRLRKKGTDLFIGTLQFKSGRLIFANKDLAVVDGRNGEQVADALFEVAQRFEAEGNTHCTLVAHFISGPNDGRRTYADAKLLEIYCSNRKVIAIQVSEGETTVSESLWDYESSRTRPKRR